MLIPLPMVPQPEWCGVACGENFYRWNGITFSEKSPKSNLSVELRLGPNKILSKCPYKVDDILDGRRVLSVRPVRVSDVGSQWLSVAEDWRRRWRDEHSDADWLWVVEVEDEKGE